MPRRSARCHRDNMPGTHPQGSYLFTGTSTGGTSPFTLVHVNHNIGTGAYTWRGWCKATTGANLNYGIFGWKNAGLGFANILYPRSFGGSNLPYVFFGSAPLPNANVQGTLNAWVHVVFTRSLTGACHWYFNGVDVTLAVVTNTFDIANLEVIIGSADNAGSLNDTIITDVLILSSEWSAGEVLLDYTSRRLGNAGGIAGTKRAYFPLDGRDSTGEFGAGTDVIDNADYGLRELIAGKTLARWGAPQWVEDSPFPTPTVDAGGPYETCQTTPVALLGTATNYGSLQWSSSGTGVFSAGTSLATNYTPSAADVAAGFVNLTLRAEGFGDNEAVTSTVILTIGSPPTPNAGSDRIIAPGETVQLAGNAGGGTNPLWTTSGDGTFDDDTSLNAIYTPGADDILNGNVTLTLTVDADPGSPCGGQASDSMDISIVDDPLPTPRHWSLKGYHLSYRPKGHS